MKKKKNNNEKQIIFNIENEFLEKKLHYNLRSKYLFLIFKLILKENLNEKLKLIKSYPIKNYSKSFLKSFEIVFTFLKKYSMENTILTILTEFENSLFINELKNNSNISFDDIFISSKLKFSQWVSKITNTENLDDDITLVSIDFSDSQSSFEDYQFLLNEPEFYFKENNSSDLEIE